MFLSNSLAYYKLFLRGETDASVGDGVVVASEVENRGLTIAECGEEGEVDVGVEAASASISNGDFIALLDLVDSDARCLHWSRR